MPAVPIPPPSGQLRGICVPCQSQGWGISKFVTARGRTFAQPRAFDTRGFPLEIQTRRILSQRTSSSSQIGSSGKDCTNLWRFSRFYAFLHCLSGTTITFQYKSTSVLSLMLFSDWLRYSLFILLQIVSRVFSARCDLLISFFNKNMQCLLLSFERLVDLIALDFYA